ncbi:DUF4139 domain-containing protein [Ideonella livida]|uniref:DUF4139 domain-containing protein n=1 Tax=Ideonella livida TaxID=2707176 RepID=A0A7C9TMD2_9BURK|nr:DUF4139 domain-containing protein [Ideonella livida]NDY91586.1 DUF4139 domain-containing protein [Ideonella livida]
MPAIPEAVPALRPFSAARCLNGPAAAATLALCAASALAQGTAPAPAGAPAGRVERVTVYPGLAQVERSAVVAAGARELVLDCLSPRLDMASLQVEAPEGVRLGAVSSTVRPRAEVPACAQSPLDGRIRALEERLSALNAEHASHELVLAWLRAPAGPAAVTEDGRGPSSAAPGGGRPLPTGAAALQGWLAGVQKSGQGALEAQARLSREREGVEAELQPLLAERERTQGQAAEVRQLRIALSTPRDQALRVVYQVPGPTWAPAYRAQLDTAAAAGPQVLLERQAQVSQHTGEDWQAVALRLSTGSPRGATAGPEPRPWALQVRQPRPAMALAAPMAMAAPMPAPAPGAERLQARAAKVEADEPPAFAVQAVEGEFATEFEVAGRVSVASGGQQVAFTLDQQRLPARLKVRTVPAQDASAWLLAELDRPEGVYPEGPLQLWRGGQVVGRSVLRAADPLGWQLPFGRDERVRVRVLPSQTQQASGGFIGSRQERRVARVYEVENGHRSPVALEVLEAGPVSLDERITVQRQFQPAPAAGDWQDQPGVVAWTPTLAPGSRLRLQADYLISHPRDLALEERR